MAASCDLQELAIQDASSVPRAQHDAPIFTEGAIALFVSSHKFLDAGEHVACKQELGTQLCTNLPAVLCLPLLSKPLKVLDRIDLGFHRCAVELCKCR